MISLIPVGLLILRLIIKGKQALFNLEIKKKSGSSINPNIHHSKVPSSGLNSQASNSMVLTKKQVLRHSFSRIHRNLCAHLCTLQLQITRFSAKKKHTNFVKIAQQPCIFINVRYQSCCVFSYFHTNCASKSYFQIQSFRLRFYQIIINDRLVVEGTPVPLCPPLTCTPQATPQSQRQAFIY